MKKLEKNIVGRYHLSVKDEDFVDVLNIIECCTVADRSLRILMKAKNGIKKNTKWHIRFNATNSEMESIKNDLLKYKKIKVMFHLTYKELELQQVRS